jgi:hypothetical protein
MSKYQPVCKCGWHGPLCETEKRAAILASIHDDAFYRRAYQHDANVREVSHDAA